MPREKRTSRSPPFRRDHRRCKRGPDERRHPYPQHHSHQESPRPSFRRFFTKAGVSPYDEIEWEKRTALITDAKGNAIFEQKDVEVPKDWSVTATNIVASKYLHGTLGTPERESGVRALVTRVAETIRDWGLSQGYFKTPEDGATFHDELSHILLRQYAAFNSPVWFNVGCDRIEPDSDAQNWHWNPAAARVEFGVTGYKTPQCSACFINSVKDSLDSILTLAKTEGMLFKWGSGTGTNLSSLRSSTEGLSGGGTASGPLSFMKGFDAFAGVIKSGGKTRRAAKMVILNIDHPDIVDFIECKSKEEAKAHALDRIADTTALRPTPMPTRPSSSRTPTTPSASPTTSCTPSCATTASPRAPSATDAPCRTSKPKTCSTRSPTPPGAAAIPACSTTPRSTAGTLRRTRPASTPATRAAEYMFLDDSACNLASLNLLKFAPNGTFDVEAYRHSVDVLITAQEILVDNAGYPTEMIAKNSHDYRPLGLGYANLGALLMAAGLPYDSDAGRDYAACVTAIMCGEAYLQSSRIAESCPPLVPATEPTQKGLAETNLGANVMPGGACPGWYINREPFLDVIRMHRASRK